MGNDLFDYVNSRWGIGGYGLPRSWGDTLGRQARDADKAKVNAGANSGSGSVFPAVGAGKSSSFSSGDLFTAELIRAGYNPRSPSSGDLFKAELDAAVAEAQAAARARARKHLSAKLRRPRTVINISAGIWAIIAGLALWDNFRDIPLNHLREVGPCSKPAMARISRLCDSPTARNVWRGDEIEVRVKDSVYTASNIVVTPTCRISGGVRIKASRITETHVWGTIPRPPRGCERFKEKAAGFPIDILSSDPPASDQESVRPTQGRNGQFRSTPYSVG
jgi:hypothetical protein